MLDSDRNLFAALGLIAGISIAFNIVGFLSVGSDWVGLEKASTNTYTYAEEQCARQQAQHAAQAASAVQEGQDVPSADPKPDQGDSGEDDEPDWCDLAAQQGMADATFGMEQAAWVALFLTAIGVALVWGTLYYTRETLDEARRATEAAQRTVEVTREIGEAQARAYLTVKSITIGRTEDGATYLEIAVGNAGNSPAIDLHALVFFRVFGAEISEGIMQIGLPDVPSGSTEVGRTIHSNAQIPIDQFGSNWLLLRGVYVRATIFAKNVFDKEVIAFGRFSKNWASAEDKPSRFEVPRDQIHLGQAEVEDQIALARVYFAPLYRRNSGNTQGTES